MSSETKHEGGARHKAPHGGHEEGHEGAPEWLISFADNVTLMMGFFVILLALNMKPDGADGGTPDAAAQPESSPALLDAAIAIRAAFNNPIDLDRPSPHDWILAERLRQRATPPDGRRGSRDRETQTSRPAEYFGLAGIVVFERGSSEFDAAGRTTIETIAAQLRGLRSMIDIRGHVSNEEAFRLDDRGMQLSADRARAVARALVAGGVGWNQVRLIACADNERLPSQDQATPAQRENQRVEVIVTSAALAGEESGHAQAAEPRSGLPQSQPAPHANP